MAWLSVFLGLVSVFPTASAEAQDLSPELRCQIDLKCANSYLSRRRPASSAGMSDAEYEKMRIMQNDCRYIAATDDQGKELERLKAMGGSVLFSSAYYANAFGVLEADANGMRFMDEASLPSPPPVNGQIAAAPQTAANGLRGWGVYFRPQGSSKVARFVWYGCDWPADKYSPTPIPFPCDALQRKKGGYYMFDRYFQKSDLSCKSESADKKDCLAPEMEARIPSIPVSTVNEKDAEEQLKLELTDQAEALGSRFLKARNEVDQLDGGGLPSFCSLMNDAEAQCAGLGYLDDVFKKSFEHANITLSNKAPGCARVRAPAPGGGSTPDGADAHRAQ